jgi:site-specific DNA-methyltransferase (adenine-specific)
MEYIKGLPDNSFELAIVDPPYGIGQDGGKFRDRKGGGHRVLSKKNWDSEAPSEDYFIELKRVSQNQIIWGANHFASKFNSSSSGWIYWDKMMGGDFSDGELAYTSFKRVLKSFSYCNKRGGAIHPTEKPIVLYKWLLKNYAQKGYKILDTHGGSMSIAIACYDLGFDLTLCELDEEYFNSGKARFDAHVADYAPVSDVAVNSEGQIKMF